MLPFPSLEESRGKVVEKVLHGRAGTGFEDELPSFKLAQCAICFVNESTAFFLVHDPHLPCENIVSIEI